MQFITHFQLTAGYWLFTVVCIGNKVHCFVVTNIWFVFRCNKHFWYV